MKTFVLNRKRDKMGVSGTGVIAEGVLSTTGKVALFWLTAKRSVAIYDSIGDMMDIHGHNGDTQIEWKNTYSRADIFDIVRDGIEKSEREAKRFQEIEAQMRSLEG